MKKYIILISFLLIKSIVYGQILTKMPEIDDQSSFEANISRVEITSENTIIYFVYEMAKPNNNSYLFQYPNQPNMAMQSTISFNPKSYLNGNGKKFKYIKSVGIPETPEEKTVKPGEKHRFSVYFEKLDPGIELFNLIEGKNNPNDKHQYWNFYGVKINNPSEQNALTNREIILKGKLLDALTEKPIQGKILYYADNNTQKSDSCLSNNSGEYQLKVKPEAYTFSASANGYETIKESIDFGQSNLKKEFNQYLYLNPLVKESKTSISPIKIDKNKFRLDKVYFDLGKAKVLEDSYEQLNLLADTLKKNESIKILIEGHTDNVGDSQENKRLSYERAYNVREYLINKGINGKRIQIKGYGDTKPISENNNENGRKNNRRVEFVIIE